MRREWSGLTANQHGGSSDVEAFPFLQGEELHNEHDQRDKGEDNGQDHEGLHCFHGVYQCIKKKSWAF